MGRHLAPRADSWSGRLRSWPWVTLVLAGLLLGGAVEVLRTDTFAATSTLVAPDSDAAQRAVTALEEPELLDRVVAEIELEEHWHGRIALSVEQPPEAAEQVQVTGTAPDPRLAALVADAAAALTVADSEGLVMSEAATAPVDPERSLSAGWWVVGALLLGLALVAEHQARRQRGVMTGPAQGAP